jgi:deoxyribodipyrimidine photolyase-related protein
MPQLRLILGDQLNEHHSWFKQINPDITYLMVEARSETDYVRHHIQKICAFFSAMRHFAALLREKGHQVIYIPLNHPENKVSLADTLLYFANQLQVDSIGYQLPDEYRVDEALQKAALLSKMKVTVADTEHFLTGRTDFETMFKGRKQILMESFYRKMRVRYNILMDASGQPIGGKWNYDHDNRKTWKGQPPIPTAPDLSNDVSDIKSMLEAAGVDYFGNMQDNHLNWPVNRRQAIVFLEHFIQHLLPHFGTYQDAMHTDENFLFHSRLSFALNTKLLHPLEVVRAVENAWKQSPDSISLSQAEGFIRQIIGWREYMRGIYWAKMPGYAGMNYFRHQRPLPAWYWTGDTRMHCLEKSIKGSLNNAYAHHIQRLMVTGNFALLAGIEPSEVDAWYLGIYIDALEWVEITNTRGMSQFADGGIAGTKPYVSTANYIDKMSNYCKGCHYDKNLKTGKNACPFNSLYWHFYHRNRHLLANNPRIGMMYVTWDKMQEAVQTAILEQAEYYLKNIEKL